MATAEQRGEQRDEREEMTGAVDGLTHLRLAVLQRFERDAAQFAIVHFCAANAANCLTCASGPPPAADSHAAAERDEPWTRVHRHASSGAAKS